MDIHAQLKELGIDIPPGFNHARVLCPKCAAGRKKYYLKDLSVTPSPTGAKFFCQHCKYGGVIGDAGPATNERTYKRPDYVHDDGLDDKVTLWFKGRGITDEAVLKRNRIGYKKVWIPQVNQEQSAIAFPYLRGGEVINVKYRTHDKFFRMEKDAELCLYGLDDVSEVLYWVEGEMDKLSLEMAGVTSCVSVPNGAPTPGAKNTERHFSYLDTVDFSMVKKHVIAVDSDGPGQQLREELIERLGAECCYLVEWPDGSKDANDVLVKYGAGELKKLIEDYTPCPIEGILEPDDGLEELVRLYDHGRELGLSPGSPKLYDLYKIRPGRLSIVTGIPSHGKSTWVDWVTHSLAETYDWKFGVYSPENLPVEEHRRKLAQLHLRTSFDGPNRMTKRELLESQQWVNNHFKFIVPPEGKGDRSVDGILKLARKLVVREAINGLVIDPWNTIDQSRRGGMSETEHISNGILKIQNFAKTHGVHVWLVAHPTKLKAVDKGDEEPKASLYDIAGSRSFYERADVGITVWRDKLNPEMPVQIHIKKVRFKPYDGEEGIVELDYHHSTLTYSDATDPEGEF